MKRGLLVLLFSVLVASGFAQTDGDYRTRNNGGWSQVNRWQVFYNGAWRNLETAGAGPYRNILPTSASGIITIRTGHHLRVSASTNANQLVIEAGARLTVNTSLVLTLVDDPSGSVNINSGGFLSVLGTLDLQSLLTSTACQVDGTLENASEIQITNPALLSFNAGSKYRHLHRTGGAIPLSTWNVGSTCEIAGLTNGNPAAPSNLGQSFWDFTWNTTNMGAASNFSLGGGLQTINGNLTFVSTGSPARQIRLDNGGPGYNLTIAGDFVFQSGLVTLTQSQTTNTSITIGGNLIQSGGTLTLGTSNSVTVDILLNGNFQKSGGIITRGTGAGAGTIRFDGGAQTYTNDSNITTAINFSVESGSNLNLGTSFLTGTGTFTLTVGGTLQVGSLDAAGAIQVGTSGGNIRTGGVRTYQSGSEIIYNGAGEQFMASGHPSAPNTTIDNPGNVFLLSNVTVNGTLNLVNGVFGLEGFTLTIGGVYTRTNGLLGIISTSSLDIEGSGAFANLFFFNYGDNSMNNFTLNRAGATIIDSHVNLTIRGSFTQTAGNLEFSAFGPRSLTLRGPIIQAAGTSIAGGTDGNDIFIISGTGAMPATINLTGTLNTLTMNRSGGTFTAGGNVLVSNLNLTDGTVVPAGLITMATGGVITREFGTIAATPLAQTSYNVVYGGAFNVTTGPEIPANTTSLNNLTLNNIFNVTNPQGSPPFTLTLAGPVFANGSLTITEGTFSTSVTNHPVSIKGNLDVAALGAFQPGQSTITFNGGGAQSITGAAPLTVFNLAVNQAPTPTSLTLNSSLDIENELAVTSSSTVFAGTNLLRLISTPARTANVGELTGGIIDGSVIVQRYIPKVDAVRNYHYMTSPVTNSNIPDWRAEFTSQRVYRWNEPTRAYVSYSLNGALPSGRGFAVDIATTGTVTADVRGTLGQGDISVPVTAASLLPEDGFNLIGNPYPSAIDWDDVPKPTGINNAIYLTDNFNNSGQGSGVQSVTYVDGVATPASYSGQIAQGQAFWVKATANTSLTFVESSKISATDAQFFREGGVPNVMRVVIEGQGVKDEAVVRLREGATRSFDGRYDAHKFFNSTFKLATLTSDNVKTAINAVGTLDCDAPIPLLVEGAASGTYELSFNGMDSFDGNISMSLTDLLENKTITITNEERYSFSVSDDNVSSLSTRFQIVINAIPANALVKAVGEKLCEGGESALVTINESQVGVHYSAEWEGEKLSDVYTGTGSTLQLRINAKNLAAGENLISILASSGLCSQVALTEKAVISKISKGEISAVQDGLTCKEGPVTLTAAGAIEGGFYNWYEEEGSIEPIAGQQGAEFVTPILTKTKTYYVAAANMLGCEGLRVPVKALVSYMEDVTLTEVTSTTLLSSYENGNHWYLNDELIEGATSNKLEVVEPGIYTVKVSLEGCTSAASREISSEAFDGGINVEPFIKIYPNPTQNKVYLQVKTINETVRATMLNSAGVEIESKGLVGENGIKECEFDLLPYASGIYNLRVFDGTKVFTKKIAKVN